jgi:uncharacterized protein YndB with AHSA1/START domain
MIHVTVERTVRQRPEVVWEFLTDVSSLSAWVEGLVEATIVGEIKEEPGMRVDLVRRDAKKRVKATTEVTAWRAPKLLALETRLDGLMLLDRATLEPTTEGTALGVYGEFYGKRLAELVTRRGGLIGQAPDNPAIQAIYERSVDALVKRIESLASVPYR